MGGVETVTDPYRVIHCNLHCFRPGFSTLCARVCEFRVVCDCLGLIQGTTVYAGLTTQSGWLALNSNYDSIGLVD